MTEFNDELRRGVRADAVAAVDDAMGAAVLQIEQHPLHLQSQLLARILSALTFGVGHFRRSEVFALDRGTRTLVVALADQRAGGGMPVEVWEQAVDAAGAAQLQLAGTE